MTVWKIDCVPTALCAALALAGCASAQHQSAGVLQQRLATQLGPQLANHQAVMEAKADGAVVRFNEATLFAPGQTTLTPTGQFIMASLAESLLDPTLMQVNLSGAPQTPDDIRLARVNSIEQRIQTYSPGPALPMTALAQPPSGAAPAEVSVEVSVHCPPGAQGSTWKYQVPGPTCN